MSLLLARPRRIPGRASRRALVPSAGQTAGGRVVPKSVDVEVRFYRIIFTNGRRGKHKEFLDFDAAKHLTALKARIADPTVGPDSRDQVTLREFGAYDVAPKATRPWLKLGRLQRDMIPQVASHANKAILEPLNTEGRPLVYGTHLVFFPNNIIGAEFNHLAPRPTTALARIFRDKFPDNDEYKHLSVHQLVKPDVKDQLNAVKDAPVVEFGFDLTSFDDVAALNNIPAAKAIADGTRAIGGYRFTIRISAEPGHKFPGAKAFAGSVTKNHDAYAEARLLKLYDRTTDGDLLPVDLLRAHIVGETAMILQEDGGSMDSKSAVAQITAVHDTEVIQKLLKRAIAIEKAPKAGS